MCIRMCLLGYIFIGILYISIKIYVGIIMCIRMYLLGYNFYLHWNTMCIEGYYTSGCVYWDIYTTRYSMSIEIYVGMRVL